MDVRCERCRAAYAVDEGRIPEAGVKVACPGCGHGFLLRKRVLAVAVPLKAGDGDVTVPVTELAPPADGSPSGADRGEWRLRQASGAVFPFRELSTLQRWIVERKASRDDEVASGAAGEDWRRLGEIPELKSFFALVDRASREPEPRREADALRGSPGMEDPAWAREPSPSPRRTTGSLPAAPAPRRRVVWVALLAVGLVAVAAVTAYLRRKVETDGALEAAKGAPVQPAPNRLEPGAGPARPAPPAERDRPAPAPAVAAAPPEPAPAATVAAPAAASGPPSATPLAATPTAGDPAPTGPAASTGPAPQQGPSAAVAVAPAEPPPAAASPEPAPAAKPPAPRPSPRDEARAALQATLARARDLRERGRSEAALDQYGQALAVDGRNATALAGRGACYLDLSRYAQAEASFVAALEVDPRNAEALFGLAETYRYMGRNAEAVSAYERFLTVRPTGEDAAAARRLVRQLKE